jgi:hypothetical protein
MPLFVCGRRVDHWQGRIFAHDFAPDDDVSRAFQPRVSPKTIASAAAADPNAKRAQQSLVTEQNLSGQRSREARRLRHEAGAQAHIARNSAQRLIKCRAIRGSGAMGRRNSFGDLAQQPESDRPQPQPNGDHEQDCAQELALANWIERNQSLKRPLRELRPGPWQPGDPGDRASRARSAGAQRHIPSG